MLVNKFMQVLRNLFGLNKKISADTIAIKDREGNADTLDNYLDINYCTNYIDGEEIPTNEFLNGKRVYAYRFIFSQSINANTEYSFDLPFSEEIDFAWVDLSNSYIDNSNAVSNFNVHCLGSTSGFQFRASIYSKSKIVILADDSWGSQWTYTIMVKFTKK